MNLNTKIRSSTLYANARTVLDSILFKFQKQPKKPPPTSSFREERGRRDRPGLDGEKVFSPWMLVVVRDDPRFGFLLRKNSTFESLGSSTGPCRVSLLLLF